MTEMLRYNTGKARLSYLPSSAMVALLMGRQGDFSQKMVNDIAAVLEFGAQKYSKDNWRTGGSWCKVADSALRHMFALASGEYNDAESGLPHAAHLGCNLVFLIEFQSAGLGEDDRFVRPEGQTLRDLDYESHPIVKLIDLLARWLESERDDYLEAALCELSDNYDSLIPYVIDASTIMTGSIRADQITADMYDWEADADREAEEARMDPVQPDGVTTYGQAFGHTNSLLDDLPISYSFPDIKGH